MRDLRELAALEPDPIDEGTVRVPDAEDMSDATRRAVRALGEMTGRNATAAAREAADEATQASRVHYWRTRDQQAEQAAGADRSLGERR